MLFTHLLMVALPLSKNPRRGLLRIFSALLQFGQFFILSSRRYVWGELTKDAAI